MQSLKDNTDTEMKNKKDNNAYADINKRWWFSLCNPSAITSLILTKTVLPLNCKNKTSCRCPATAIWVFHHPIFSFPIPKYLLVPSWGIKRRPASQSSGCMTMMRWCGWGRKTTKTGDNNQQDKNCANIARRHWPRNSGHLRLKEKGNFWGFAALPSERSARAVGILRHFGSNVRKNTDADRLPLSLNTTDGK